MSGDEDRRAIKLDQRKGESYDEAIARASVDPAVQGALTLLGWGRHVSQELDLTVAADALRANSKAVHANDLEQLEGMLTSQAHVLDAIFNDCARRALLNRAEYPDAFDRYMKIAFRAQSQCRASIEAIGELKNPRPFVSVGQANVANGPQQVNNGPVHAPEEPKRMNELLEHRQDEQRLDFGTAGFAGSSNPALEPVAKVNGPAIHHGKGQG